jgi:hypothetical protein
MDIKMQSIPKALYVFLNKKWHFDQIVNELIVVKLMNFGYLTTFQSLDKGLIERIGPTGFTVSTFSLAFNFRSVNSGILYHTATIFIVFVALFIVFFILGCFNLALSFSVSFFALLTAYFLILLSDS